VAYHHDWIETAGQDYQDQEDRVEALEEKNAALEQRLLACEEWMKESIDMNEERKDNMRDVLISHDGRLADLEGAHRVVTRSAAIEGEGPSKKRKVGRPRKVQE
jgi:hypothetical protein